MLELATNAKEHCIANVDVRDFANVGGSSL